MYIYPTSARTLVRRDRAQRRDHKLCGRGTKAQPACPVRRLATPPTLVSISKPRGVGSDAAGNIYIADYSLNKVFKVGADDRADAPGRGGDWNRRVYRRRRRCLDLPQVNAHLAAHGATQWVTSTSRTPVGVKSAWLTRTALSIPSRVRAPQAPVATQGQPPLSADQVTRKA